MSKKQFRIGGFLAILGLFAFITAGCAWYGNETKETAERSVQAEASEPVAAGTEGDNLEACLKRIPGNATAGQRMLAEKSCHRDEEHRQPYHNMK